MSIKRIIIGSLAYLLAVYVFYRIGLFFSDMMVGDAGTDRDVHGFPGVLFTVSLAPLALVLGQYLATGKLKIQTSNGNLNQTPVPASNILNSRISISGISITAAVFLLVFFWSLVIGYCELLRASMYEAVTDKSIIGISLNPVQTQRLLTTIGGTIYFGSFFPLVAATAFLSGWISRNRLPFWALLIPSFVLYLLMNVISYLTSGQPTVVRGIRQVVSSLQYSKKPVPETAADGLLVWAIASAVFLVIVVMLALYGWAWTSAAVFVRQRLYRANSKVAV